jgi:hypothetical protein
MSGGMIVGINQECFKIENNVDGEYYNKFVLKK